MYQTKTPRILLSFFLILGVFSSLTLPSVQAENSSSTTLSPAITAKLDAFVEKMKALRPKYNSDADWNTFLDKLNTKVSALRSQYMENALILAVLDRLSSGVNGLKVQENGIGNADKITVLSIIPTTGTFDLHKSSSGSIQSLTFTLYGTNRSDSDLEMCMESVEYFYALNNKKSNPGYCDNSDNFKPFNGNANWRWDGSNLVGILTYDAKFADLWGSIGSKIKIVFRKKTTPIQKVSAIINITNSASFNIKGCSKEGRSAVKIGLIDGYWDCEKKCPLVGWPAFEKTGIGYFSDNPSWGYWYSGDGLSGPIGMDEYTGEYTVSGRGTLKGAYNQDGHWYNE